MTRPRRLFIVIGMPKAGLGSLACAFDKLREQLYRGGVLYPQTGGFPGSGRQHALLAAAYRTASSTDDACATSDNCARAVVVSALRQEIEASGAGTVVLVSTRFWGMRGAAAQIGEDFRDFAITPVVIMRDPVEIAEAERCTAICSGQPSPPLSPWLDLDLVSELAPWAAVSASGRIAVEPYYAEDGVDVVTQILSFIGQGDLVGAVRDLPRVNASRFAEAVVRQTYEQNGRLDPFHWPLVDRIRLLTRQPRLALLSVEERRHLSYRYRTEIERLKKAGIASRSKPLRTVPEPAFPPDATIEDVALALAQAISA